MHFHLTLTIKDSFCCCFGWVRLRFDMRQVLEMNYETEFTFWFKCVCVYAASCTSYWNYKCLQFPKISTSLRKRSPARAKNEPSKNRSAPLPSKPLFFLFPFLSLQNISYPLLSFGTSSFKPSNNSYFYLHHITCRHPCLYQTSQKLFTI